MAIPIMMPLMVAPRVLINQPVFSPLPSAMWVKYSAILDGIDSTCYYSKYSTSCFMRLARYLARNLKANLSDEIYMREQPSQVVTYVKMQMTTMIGMKSLKVLCYSVVSSVGLKLSTILPMTIPYVGSTHPPAREKNTPSQNTNFSHSVEYLYRSVYPALGLGGGFAAFTGAFSSGAFPSLILP